MFTSYNLEITTFTNNLPAFLTAICTFFWDQADNLYLKLKFYCCSDYVVHHFARSAATTVYYIQCHSMKISDSVQQLQ